LTRLLRARGGTASSAAAEEFLSLHFLFKDLTQYQE
jgi:hypothetical protein